MAGIRGAGKDRGRGQVDGLTWQDVERMCILAEVENTLTGLRDAALIRLMFERNVLDPYREGADITDVAVFRHIRRGDHIQTNRLHPHAVLSKSGLQMLG